MSGEPSTAETASLVRFSLVVLKTAIEEGLLDREDLRLRELAEAAEAALREAHPEAFRRPRRKGMGR